jgi:chromosomal replication initiation ATPase DnaA
MTIYDAKLIPHGPAYRPSQKEPPLSERIAEAKRLRGKVPQWKLYQILKNIYASARDSGEYSSYIKEPPSRPSEIDIDGLPKIATIMSVVENHYGLISGEIMSRHRPRWISRPRHIAMYLTRVMTPHSFTYIAKQFARDHTAVMFGCRKVMARIATDSVFAEEIEALKGKLK